MKELNQFIKFIPILKEKIWGGEKLIQKFNKKSTKKNIGESWELSDLEDDVSIVASGKFKGFSLRELIGKYKGELLGEKVYRIFEGKFPLLIKFIDAKEILSLQVHPDDKMAKKYHQSNGKTELWYVLETEKDAEIIVGFSEETNRETFQKKLSEGQEMDVLNVDFVKKGDTYLIPSGQIHAIGKGVLLAEIQETSDITYRVSDWGRVDENGNSREIHLERALEALNYSAKSNYKSEYFRFKNTPSTIVDCKYFTTNYIQITSLYSVDHEDKDSFVIYMCVDGKVEFLKNEMKEFLEKGETLLVPASFKNFEINPISKSELLEVYINTDFYS